MIPYELTLHNFMCYRGEQPPLCFDGLHISCLSGENGAGKSALLDAITWAMWGKARMSDDELIAQGESEMLVELTFQLDGQFYRVIRRRQRAGSGRSSGKSTLDLHIREGETWRSISEGTLRETDQKIASLLRMKYDTFINASFLLQGRADEFTRKTPSERKEVLTSILDLRDYADLETRAKKQAKELEGQVRALEGIIGHLEAEAGKLPLYEQLVAEAEEKVATREAALHKADQDKARADEQVRQLEAKQQRQREIRKQLDTLYHDLQRQQQELADLRHDIGEAESLLNRREEISAGVAHLEAARHELERLDSLRPCYEALVEQRGQLQDALKDERRKLQSEHDSDQREVERLRNQLAQRPGLDKRNAELDQHMAELDSLGDELQRVRSQLTALDKRISRVNTRLLRRTELLGIIAQRYDSLVAVREEQKRIISRLQKQRNDVPGWQAALEEATQQRQRVQEMSAHGAALRKREQHTAERAGELRAQCAQFKQQADDVKKRQTLLADVSATTCPLCGSDLGTDGVHTITNHYEQEIERLRSQYRTAKKEADAHEAELRHLRQEVQAHEQQLAHVQQGAARVESLRERLAQAETWRTEQEQAQTTLDDVERQLATNDYEREAHEALLTVCGQLTEDGIDEKTPGTTPLERERKTLAKRQSELERRLDSRATLQGEATTIRTRLDELDREAKKLPACECRTAEREAQIRTGDFGHEIRAEGRAIEAQIADLGYTPEGHEAARTRERQLLHWTEEAQRLDFAESSLERDRRALEQAEELLKRYEDERAALLREDAQREQEVRALPTARHQASACEAAVKQCRRDLVAANNDLAEKRTLRTEAQKKAKQLAQHQKERAALVERQSIFQELAEACGKKGVQAMLIETAIPEIEREANRLLSRMSDNQMHLTFDMQRSTVKGDTVETLEIKIADALGTRDYKAFSGGEAMRINFAVRIALSRLLARRAGASLETLVIDEGFGTLDSDGRERFVEAITSVQNDFQRIIVITHVEELKERFPAHIQVSKTATGSVWELV